MAVHELPVVGPIIRAARNHGELPLAGSFYNAVKVYAARIVLLVGVAVVACGFGALGVLISTVSPSTVGLVVSGAVMLFLLGGLVGAAWTTQTLGSVSRGHTTERRLLNAGWRALEDARRAKGESALCRRCHRPLSEPMWRHMAQRVAKMMTRAKD
jgi:hypothetical protein